MTHTGVLVAFGNKKTVRNCFTCGYAHLDDMPSAEVITAFYGAKDAEYGNIDGKAWLQKEEAEYRAGLWDAAFKWQSGVLPKKPLLDVGCGSGWFFDWWRNNINPWSFGVEPSFTARDCQTIGTVFHSLDEALEFGYKFSTIRFSLVLEHVTDPAALIKSYLPLLAPGGKIMVIVPNEFNQLQRLARRKRGDWFVASTHLNYFTPQTLRILLEKCGLTVEFEGATFPMEIFLALGLNYVDNPALGRKLHRARLWFEKLLGAKAFDLYSWLYRRWGIGREVVMVAHVKDNE